MQLEGVEKLCPSEERYDEYIKTGQKEFHNNVNVFNVVFEKDVLKKIKIAEI